MLWLVCVCIIAPVCFRASITVAQEIDFNRDIRPILSDKCFFCHGPDEKTQEAGLRLDSREEAIDVIESGDLIERITTDDPDMLMPPPDSRLALTKEDKKTIQAWIQQGAKYEGHWAFKLLPDSVEVPNSNQSDWPRQTLDHFVLNKVKQADMAPSKPARPLRWLRRATLDLTGLPPTPEQIQAFEKAIAQSPEQAYSAATDRLLNSSAFGEHMAIAWLDASRYADSYGYQSDKLNTQWPYRDWVVQAFNNNLPYDKFLSWQLAGDLLENPTAEQRLATAFNRIHRLNNEGGAVFEEWRVENVADRVHTFGTAVLGLTFECSRCHDHKYDPITMRDYYSLSAFFNSIDESGVYDRSEKVPCPSMLLPTEEQQKALDSARQAVAEAEQTYQEAVAKSNQRFSAWQKKQTQFDIPDLHLGLSFDRKFDNSIKEIYHPSESDRAWTRMPELVNVTDSKIARIPTGDSADIIDDADISPDKKFPRLAMQLDGERGITTKGVAPFDRWLPFSVVVTLRETKRVSDRSLIAHHTRGTDCGYNGWDLTIENGHLESRMYRVWPGNAIGVRTTDPIPVDQWHQVAATYDGSSQADGLKLFLNGKPLATTVLRDQVKKSANVKVDHGGEFVVGQRFRARGLAGGLIDDVRVYWRNLTSPELVSLATGQPVASTANYFASAVDQPTREAFAKLNSARKAMVMAEEAMNEIPIMLETEQKRPAHVLARGQYDAEKNDSTLVSRKIPAGLTLPFPKNAPLDRLGLAQWVIHPQHPLTSRVAVNRLWSNFFESPLVRTPENFGSQGELPTHPELLDWLARDFINSGWDVKRFCRNVVLSSTYMQDSASTPERMQKDPTNRLLARGPSYRLAAEQIRDVALAASGLMDPEIGGPPVSPYQPGEDLWRESNGMSPPYKQSVGQALYRRSLYSVWKRTAPLPNMMAFDSTTREVCTVKRSRTNTPLQALVLLNDVQFVEASRKLAEKMLTTHSETSKQIEQAFVTLTGRNPDAEEQSALETLFEQEHDYFERNSEAAKKLLSLGENKSDEKLDATRLAAMTTICQTILNLDATIWKR